MRPVQEAAEDLGVAAACGALGVPGPASTAGPPLSMARIHSRPTRGRWWAPSEPRCSLCAPELLAERPNQVWSWDITKLLVPEKWSYFQRYVIIDIYSGYIVGWMIAAGTGQRPPLSRPPPATPPCRV